MRHECECQHNARNIHFQDTVKIFGDPNADVGSAEKTLYENYKSIERNVQNAIELLASKIGNHTDELSSLILEIEQNLEDFYKNLPDLSQYVRMQTNNVQISNPQIIILSQMSYDNLTIQNKLDARKIYLIADLNSSADPYLNSEVIFQRSIFINGSAREAFYGDDSNLIITLHPIRYSGPLFSNHDYEILEDLFHQRQTTGSLDNAIEIVLNKYQNSQADQEYIRQWQPYMDLLTQFDLALFGKYAKTLGTTIYENNESAIQTWKTFLQTYDPIGYWQTLDINGDFNIDARDATLILKYAVRKGMTPLNQPVNLEGLEGMAKWANQIDRSDAIDGGVFYTLNATLASLILSFSARHGSGAFGTNDQFDALKKFINERKNN